MNRLKFLRISQKLSQRELGDLCEPPVNVTYICNAESRGLRLTDQHLQRLAKVLNWDGDPKELLEEAVMKD